MDLKTDLKFSYSAAIEMNGRSSLLKMAVFARISKGSFAAKLARIGCEFLLPPEGAAVPAAGCRRGSYILIRFV